MMLVAIYFPIYGLALFAGNVVIESDEGAKQSPNWEIGNEKWETGNGKRETGNGKKILTSFSRFSPPISHLLSILTSRLSLPECAIASSQAPRNDKMLKYSYL